MAPSLIVALWSSTILERGSQILQASLESVHTQAMAIQEAQDRGLVTNRYSAHELFLPVMRLSQIGNPLSPKSVFPGADPPAARDLIARAVAQLVAP